MHRLWSSISLHRRSSKWCAMIIGGGFFVIWVIYLITQQQPQIQITTPEVRKFAFMKNHKCASSTIENIIFRYAYNNKLNVALPSQGNYLSVTELFDHKSLNKAKWMNVPFDIFSLHNRWNRKEVMALLKEEVPTFTIIRDPVEVFVSMFYFLDKFREFYGTASIHDLVHMIQETPQLPKLRKRFSGFIGRNQMAWDMGLSPDIFDNETAVQKEIERLDREFDLVMISNRMNESLVLLSDLLNWPLERVLHLDLNRRKPDKSAPLTLDERNVLMNWLAADAQIFNHFSRRFDERVADLNRKKRKWENFDSLFSLPYVEKQMLLLKEGNDQLHKVCVIEEVGNEKLLGKFKETNNNIIGYIINEKQEGCDLFAMSEPAYLEIFRKSLLIQSKRKIIGR